MTLGAEYSILDMGHLRGEAVARDSLGRKSLVLRLGMVESSEAVAGVAESA
tara:strand:+ start:408 stop:560 length:153 start_codon:yes stop_codon:yes gene_type:complete